MVIGVDFDNTIVCYDQVFHQVAREQGLIPHGLPPAKHAVRDYLRSVGREPAWTELQGLVYGARMDEALPFPGVEEFFIRAVRSGVDVRIISHKTKFPFSGPRHDLHSAALSWLERRGFHDPARIGLPRDHVHLELTKADKAKRVVSCACDYFIDDLPEFLAELGGLGGTRRILFDPNSQHAPAAGLLHARSWRELETMVWTGKGAVT